MQEPAPTSQATTPFDGITIPTCGIAQIAPKGLYKYWTTDADESISDLYDKIKEDVAFRLEWAEKCGLGSEPPSIVRKVPKSDENETLRGAA